MLILEFVATVERMFISVTSAGLFISRVGLLSLFFYAIYLSYQILFQTRQAMFHLITKERDLGADYSDVWVDVMTKHLKSS